MPIEMCKEKKKYINYCIIVIAIIIIIVVMLIITTILLLLLLLFIQILTYNSKIYAVGYSYRL